MKILYIGAYNDTEILTGPEKVAKRIFDKSTSCYKSEFITYFSDGRKYGLFKKLFGKENISQNESAGVHRLGISRILLRIIRFKPDIIHVITFERFSLLAVIYKQFSNVRLIYNVHGIAEYENKNNPRVSSFLKLKDSLCERALFRNSDKIIFLSVISRLTAENYYDLQENKIEYIPNGVDKIFYQTGNDKKTRHGAALNIVFVGDVTKKEKGFEMFINSMDKIEFQFKIFVVGRSAKQDFDLKSNINLLFIDKMATGEYAKFLFDKDIFVSASSYEQFSLAAVETMAAGLVPIVTKETGMSSFIENERNGFVIESDNSEQLNALIQHLNSNRTNMEQLSEEARKIYFTLNWETVFEKYKKLYS